MRLNY